MRLINGREQRLDDGFAWGLYAAEAGGAGLSLMRIRAVQGFESSKVRAICSCSMRLCSSEVLNSRRWIGRGPAGRQFSQVGNGMFGLGQRCLTQGC